MSIVGVIDIAEQKLGRLDNTKDSSSEALCVSRKWFEEKQAEARQEGREEAWDLARRIAAFGEDTYTWQELDSVFGSQCDNIIFEMPVDKALAKDKEYREGKNTLCIGDEVEFGVLRGYIIEILLSGEVRVLTKIYGTFTVSCKECKKTGKHSEEIERAMASFEKGESHDNS